MAESSCCLPKVGISISLIKAWSDKREREGEENKIIIIIKSWEREEINRFLMKLNEKLRDTELSMAYV